MIEYIIHVEHRKNKTQSDHNGANKTQMEKYIYLAFILALIMSN